MRTCKKFLMIVLAIVSIGAFLAVNRYKKSSPSVETTSIQLCPHCGQIKGSELCCKPDEPKDLKAWSREGLAWMLKDIILVIFLEGLFKKKPIIRQVRKIQK